MEVNSGMEEVPLVDQTLVPQTTFTELINQIEQSIEEIDGSLPEQTLIQPTNLIGQKVHPDLHMADSSNWMSYQTPP